MAGWSRHTPFSIGHTLHGGLCAAGQVDPFTAERAGGIRAEEANRTDAVQASMVRVFLCVSGHN